jgi:hypothetical protein
MMMSLFSTTNNVNAAYRATATPRQQAKQPKVQGKETPLETVAISEDTLVKQALSRTKPDSILMAEELDYRAPLVAFLASPAAIKKEGLKWGAIIGTGMGAVLGGVLLAMPKSRETLLKGIGLFAAALGGGALVGTLCGWVSGEDEARNQAWVNKNVFDMMDLTSTTATLAQGNKALKAETGDSFSEKLARNESRRRDEETQRMILANQVMTLNNRYSY